LFNCPLHPWLKEPRLYLNILNLQQIGPIEAWHAWKSLAQNYSPISKEDIITAQTQTQTDMLDMIILYDIKTRGGFSA